MKKLCFVVSSPSTVRCSLMGHLAALEANEITVVADFAGRPQIEGLSPQVRCVPIRIRREIDVRRDVGAVLRLWLFMRRERFDFVYSQTPKAGLLAMVAAKLAGVRVRIHAFTGQVWATRRGWYRWMLKNLDRLIFACASEVLVDSPSQRKFLLEERVVTPERSSVVADGSICGVEMRRFAPNAAMRSALRERLGLPETSFVFLFVGRLYREKGIYELVEAFCSLHASDPDTRLLVVGPDEEGVVQALGPLPGVVIHDHTDRPEDFYASADVFCLPSHREGFGLVIIEAAACGIPAMGSNIYGISDAIADGETGILHKVGDVADIQRVMQVFVEDRELTRRMGERATNRARARFSSERVISGFVDRVMRCLTEL